MNKFYALAVGLLAGLVLGLVGAFVQADRIRVSEHLIPYGAVLAISLIAVAQLWLVRHFQTRVAALAIAAGWIIATFVMGKDHVRNTAIIVEASWSKIYFFSCPIILGIICTISPLRPLPDSDELPEAFAEVMPTGKSPANLESENHD